MVENSDHATVFVNRLHEEYDVAKKSQNRATRIKKAAVGTVLATTGIMGLEATHAISPPNDVKDVVWMTAVAGGVASSKQKRIETESKKVADNKLREASSLSDPRRLGDNAAPLQSWITEASLEGTTSIPVEVPIADQSEETPKQ